MIVILFHEKFPFGPLTILLDDKILDQVEIQNICRQQVKCC